MAGASPAPRRDEALAFIIDRLVRTGTSPSIREIARELGVSKARAEELVEQLIGAGVLAKTPGAQRGLRVRDVARARDLAAAFARSLGWIVATPLGELQQTCPHVQLPMLPPFEHLPDVE